MISKIKDLISQISVFYDTLYPTSHTYLCVLDPIIYKDLHSGTRCDFLQGYFTAVRNYFKLYYHCQDILASIDNDGIEVPIANGSLVKLLSDFVRVMDSLDGDSEYYLEFVSRYESGDDLFHWTRTGLKVQEVGQVCKALLSDIENERWKLKMGYYDGDLLAASVLDKIEDFTEEDGVDACFTAWDITVTLRTQGGTTKVSHSDVKTVVHTVFLTGSLPKNYTRSSIDIPGGNPPQAWLYHPVDVDPDEYTSVHFGSSKKTVDDIRGLSQGGTPTPVIVGTLDYPSGHTYLKPSYSASPAPGTFTVNDECGRFCVPSQYIRSIGLAPGDTAYVLLANPKHGSITVLPSNPSGYDAVPYTVDKSCNIRIKPGTLKIAGCNFKNFWVQTNNAEVVISEAVAIRVT